MRSPGSSRDHPMGVTPAHPEAAENGSMRSMSMRGMRILAHTPPSLFSIPFGLAGLAVVWRLMASSYGSPAALGDALFIASGVVWLVLGAGAIARLLKAPRVLVGELRDPLQSPFWALPWIVGMLVAFGLEPYAHAVGGKWPSSCSWSPRFCTAAGSLARGSWLTSTDPSSTACSSRTGCRLRWSRRLRSRSRRPRSRPAPTSRFTVRLPTCSHTDLPAMPC
jgi:voltage-gated anion channel